MEPDLSLLNGGLQKCKGQTILVVIYQSGDINMKSHLAFYRYKSSIEIFIEVYTSMG